MTSIQNPLDRIAKAIGVPVETFFDPSIRHRLSDLHDLITLWTEGLDADDRDKVLAMVRQMVASGGSP